VIQNSVIAVDEEGAEAASVLAMPIAAGAVPQPRPVVPFEFIADRPFSFWVTDKATGSILFMGRFACPEADEPSEVGEGKEEPRNVAGRMRAWINRG
jgi:serpin B